MAISKQRPLERFERATMLERQACSHGSVPSVRVALTSGLARLKEDFADRAVGMSADRGRIALAGDFKVEAFVAAAVFESLPHHRHSGANGIESSMSPCLPAPAMAGFSLARRGAGGAEIILVGKRYDDGYDAGTTLVRRQFCGNGYDGYDALYECRPVPCCRGVVCGYDAVRRPGGVSGSGVAVQFFSSAHCPRHHGSAYPVMTHTPRWHPQFSSQQDSPPGTYGAAHRSQHFFPLLSMISPRSQQNGPPGHSTWRPRGVTQYDPLPPQLEHSFGPQKSLPL